jgi:dTDP-glucose pyrophosphorylase
MDSEYWQNTVLPIDSTVAEAVNKLNTFRYKLVMVVNDQYKLLGTISDGDIRRGLLSGYDLETSLIKIMNLNPIVVRGRATRESINQLMIKHKIQQIPIVDENFQVTGLHLWDELFTPELHPNTIIIMAGGKGTRMYPRTKLLPKPLLPIAGKPILKHIIINAKKQGFTNFILSINYLGHMIEEYFGDGKTLGVQIEYIRERIPLGTSGSLSLLNPRPVCTFIVTNGDVLTDINYLDLLNFHHNYKADLTIAVKNHHWQNPFGVIKTQDMNIIGYEEKPISISQINTGIYALEPSTLDYLNTNEICDMPELIDRIGYKSKKVIAFPIHEKWIDIGHPDQFESAENIALNLNE